MKDATQYLFHLFLFFIKKKILLDLRNFNATKCHRNWKASRELDPWVELQTVLMEELAGFKAGFDAI